MEDILLAVMIIFVFALGYLVTDRVWKQAEKRADPEPVSGEERFCTCTLSPDQPEDPSDGCEVIIVRTNDPDVITCLERAGCTVGYDPGSRKNIPSVV
ncbi:MAG: hypothetical protein IJR97_01910 [Clostridia bacterium]|nr:hypothetical protein [Clostridia bacterium]